jgi:UDP-glucose 4-epimerase
VDAASGTPQHGTVLVFGSGGYMGRRVVSALRRRGATVVGADLFVRPGSGDVAVDIRFADQTMALINHVRPAVVICLSYLLTPSEANLKVAVDTNISGITGLFEACVALKVPRVLYASTSAVYGGKRIHGDADVAEAAVKSPNHIYGWMKLFNDVTAQHYNKTSDTQFIGIRI